MTYVNGETLILTVLQGVTGFSSANTSRGKWGILNSGRDNNYGIIKPGSFEREQSAISANMTTYQTIIQVWNRYKDDGTTLTDLEALVDSIIARFDARRKGLDTSGTIIDMFIASGREVEEMWNKSGGLSWLKQDLVVTWMEESTITYVE